MDIEAIPQPATPVEPAAPAIGRAPQPPPAYRWELVRDDEGRIVFEEDFRTISRYLVEDGAAAQADVPLPVARLAPSAVGRQLVNAYHASAMRFRLGLNHDRRGTGTGQQDVVEVLPSTVRELVTRPAPDVSDDEGRPAASAAAASEALQRARAALLTAPDDDTARERIDQLQSVYRAAMRRELLPRMTGNAYDPSQHPELPAAHQRVFARIVDLQNDPVTYFGLVQQIEARALLAQRRSHQAGGPALSDTDALVVAATEVRYGTTVDAGSTDIYDGDLIENMATGVTIPYMQEVRRSGRPFLTFEFRGTGHSGLAHLMQDVVNYLYAAQHPDVFDGLPPERLEQMTGEVDSAHVDALSEMYLEGFVNPANPNVWHAIMRYTSMEWQ